MKTRHLISRYIKKIRDYGFGNSLKIAGNRRLKHPYPESICVEIMTVCNLRCEHCRVTYHGDAIPDVTTGFMDYSKFTEIADKLAPLIKKAVFFQFSTIEPLFHKKLFEMMDYVSGINGRMVFPILTNGMLLTESNIVDLLKRKVYAYSISLDGYKRETVEGFKKGVDYYKVLENIKLLRKIGGTKVNINTVFVATKMNIVELPEYVELCHGLGVDGILVNGFQAFFREKSGCYLYGENGNMETEEIFKEANIIADKKNIRIMFPHLMPRKIGCGASSQMFVSEKGDVSQCVILARRTPLELFGKTGTVDAMIFGNLFEEGPEHIWNKPEFVDFRDSLRKGVIPTNCELCADAYGLICSNRKYL